MKLIYPGPSEAVEIDGVTCERGKPADVPDVHVDSLLAQGWTEPRKVDAEKKTAAKK